MSEDSRKKWLATMIKKHGSEKAVRDFMAAAARKAKHTGEGGFKHMAKHDPKRLSEISKKGGSIGKRS